MDPKPEDKTTEETVRHEESWRARVAADLLSHKAEKEQLWGGIDELTLARHEGGLGTDEERARVEQALRDHPALRECLEISRELSADQTVPGVEEVQEKRRGVQPQADHADRAKTEPGQSR